MATATHPAGSKVHPRKQPGGFFRGAGSRLRKLAGSDFFGHLVTAAAALSILLITAGLIWVLWAQSALARQTFGWGFLIGRTWNPLLEHLGALPFIYGTVVTSVIALLIAVPLGLGAAIFLAELAPPKISSWLAFVIDLLAAVPSVIYGLLGIFILVSVLRTVVGPTLQKTLGFLPLFQGPIYGIGFLAGGVILAIMVVPFIISVSREVLLAVPREQREGALAVGATRWEATWQVVVPFARTGIYGSIFLALARALGETMAITMVIGNDPRISASLFSPGYSIAAVLANEFVEATTPVYISALIELGLVLFCLTIVLNGLARLLILATSRRGGAHA